MVRSDFEYKVRHPCDVAFLHLSFRDVLDSVASRYLLSNAVEFLATRDANIWIMKRVRFLIPLLLFDSHPVIPVLCMICPPRRRCEVRPPCYGCTAQMLVFHARGLFKPLASDGGVSCIRMPGDMDTFSRAAFLGVDICCSVHAMGALRCSSCLCCPFRLCH